MSQRNHMRATGRHPDATSYQMSSSEHMFKKMLRNDATVKQRFRCIYCQERMTLQTATAEHVVAKSRGGATERKNIKGACQPCNKAKGNGSDAWFRRILNGPEMPISDPELASAYIRFRINRKVEKAEKRIRAYVGMAQL